ncbi:MAG: hypothetical protein IRZ16_12380 [Myxococcaceae bacterium]|nr:hypothetical protein [Myxococcaceae bacterium]
MVTQPRDASRPLWVRAASLRIRTRALVTASVGAVYLILFLVVGPEYRLALRPLNVLVVVAGGFFFGFRGGLGLSALTVVVNLVLYWRFGILARTGGDLFGNLLSVVIGLAVGAGTGWMRDLSLRLRHEVARRQDAERQKEELTALLVHDLKNPLTAISGHAQLLTSTDLDCEVDRRESALFIGLAAERLNRMVMNLLDVRRAEDGVLAPRYQSVEVGRLLDEVHRAMRPLLNERGQQLEMVQRSERGRIEADPDLVRRILLNLVENAVKYTPPRQTVRVELAEIDGHIDLTVSDQGPGIPPGYEERIFDKYTRLERDAATAADSSRGLGLHFCKLAAMAHGGRIWVEHNQPRGSVFRVRLPRAPH